jgi:predicted hydrocarbon binding protein
MAQHLRSEIVNYNMSASNLVTVAGETLTRLRGSAESASGADALREAGHVGGSALYAAFAESLKGQTGDDPAALSLEEFSAKAGTFFAEAGWGMLRLRSSHDALAVIDIENCWESQSGGSGCHITTGVLAGFLSPLADYPVAVMEVECGSEGSASCRFLAGNAEMMDDAYQRLVAGESWETFGSGDL